MCHCHCHITLSLPRDTTTRQLDTWQIFYFLKKSKKEIKNKKISKKISKIQKLTRGTPLNGVTVPLMEGTKLRQKQIKGPN